MRFKKSGLILIIISCAFILIMSACTKKPVTVSFWHIYNQDHLKAAWHVMADKFMKINPHITIYITIIEGESYKQKIES